jgi:transcription elongation factor Elf1
LDEEAIVAWQDVLDEIAAGRSRDLACPHCGARPLSVHEESGLTRISCPACQRYVEGRLGGLE